MNNLEAHKVAPVTAAIEAVGASRPIPPPYSPDLNPIEQMFAKLKGHLRKAATRTYDALRDEIGLIISALSPQECCNTSPIQAMRASRAKVL